MGITERFALKKRIALLETASAKIGDNITSLSAWTVLIDQYKAIYTLEWKARLHDFLTNATENKFNSKYTPQDTLLIKSMEDPYLEKLISGQLFCRPSEDFRKMERDARGDADDCKPFKGEIKGLIELKGNSKISKTAVVNDLPAMTYGSQTVGSNSSASIGNMTIQIGGMNHLYCLSSIEKVKLDQFFKAYDKSKFKGQNVVLITNTPEFINRVRAKNLKHLTLGLVSYLPNEVVKIFDIIPSFIKKTVPYLEEFEFRLSYTSSGSSEAAECIDIGDISDIAQIVSLDSLEEKVRKILID
ncbi:hypothetical protein [Vibrio crassostreae]|uniref:hypothetical protein n=1 Tax=Vibrio crassostreae TaxID=246167 RepID=UPI00062F344B|nr:hypothetical protein [Vibrio crassostreae]TCO00576.1 hypothetical protein EDB30_111149 [Vibrio crassostreae]CAK2052219.1 hypothetical protein VCRA2119O381_410021 [Vibrio crassostreae]CAK2065405.1 hypothetical protein VCRA2117O379_30303 [Vibrio crassostreae]CAK2066632.1 hypothetical protein VCRA2119O382_30303 [Vibrio crassostreae]CAK2069538.1 hypothetical protein VCRA2117O380_30303 [Vibrio crassostreae]